jgi:N-acetyl sugar amidotransferase
MVQCKACLYTTDHPFGLTLTNGLCSGCITHREKYSINWEKKYQELESIANWAKDRSKRYDCVVPVIGDAEDYYVVSKVLELGLNPLIVSVNSYFLNDIGWSNLQNLITYFDLDSWIYNPEIQTYKELIRTSIRKYNHMYLPWLQLHTSFPVHVAKEKKISLVVWGANQAVEQVGKFSHYDKVEMSSWSRIEHDLFGNNIEALMGNGAQVNERKINNYRYPSINNLGKNIRGVYLSNYMHWDPIKQNHSTLAFGFIPESNRYTFDPYERAGSSVYYGVHDLMKYERLGYKKIKDHITRDLRHGRIQHAESDRFQQLYMAQKTSLSQFKAFFDWLQVTDSGFDWYLGHKLLRSKELLAPECSEPILISEMPSGLQDVVSPGKVPNEFYLKFYKGIHI